MSQLMYFLYKVIPPRPTFFNDQTEHEAAVMGEHMAYWTGQLEAGTVVAFGPVLEPTGVWGVAILEVSDESQARNLVAGDPVVRARIASTELIQMPVAVVRGRQLPSDA